MDTTNNRRRQWLLVLAGTPVLAAVSVTARAAGGVLGPRLPRGPRGPRGPRIPRGPRVPRP